MNNYIYLGLDISLNSTGYGILNSNKELLDFGIFTYDKSILKSNKSPIEIIHLKIDSQLSQLELLLSKHKIHKCFIERFSFGSFKFSNSSSVLGETTGCIKQFLWNKKIPYSTYAPTSVKKYITGSGKAKKDQISKEILNKYPQISSNKNDITDAISVCLTGIGNLSDD